ncbi:MAG: energy transducer TonB, partial [Verrucomicrobiota bacterium]|nr:energy transducer TonB [Verrucomicrobiota bacterium]
MRNKYEQISSYSAYGAMILSALALFYATISCSGEKINDKKTDENKITLDLEIFEEVLCTPEPKLVPEPLPKPLAEPALLPKALPAPAPVPLPEPLAESKPTPKLSKIIQKPVIEPIPDSPKAEPLKRKQLKKVVKEKTVSKTIPLPKPQPKKTKSSEKRLPPIKKKILTIDKKKILISRLIKLINKNKSYSRLARRRNIEGAVCVSFAISAEGSISSFEIEKSSHKLLTKSVQRTCKRISGCKLTEKSINKKLTVKVP